MAKRKLRVAERSKDDSSGIGRILYSVADGCICVKRTSGTLTIEQPLANFSAQIAREVIRDDGVDEHRRFEVRGKLADGTELPPIHVDAEDLSGPGWALEMWGARANVSAERDTAAHLRAALQTLSNPESTRVYRHTGIREIDGKRVFLHAGGAIGASGVVTDIGGELARYRFPVEVHDPREALETSLRFLDLAPLAVTVPMHGGAFRAPTCSILPCDMTIWLFGKTGSLKSTLLGSVLNHFGDFGRTGFPGSWEDTAASIENLLFLCKDVLGAVDDFAPKAGETWDDLRAKAGRVLRAVGNGAARGRMNSDSTARPNRPPRGLLISTGEDMPNGESILARILVLRIVEGTVSKALVSELETSRSRLNHAMAGYIGEFVLPHYAMLQVWVPERFRELRSLFQSTGGHLRTPEALAHVALGVEMMTLYAVQIGLFNAPKAAKFNKDALEVLRTLGATQGADVRSADPVLRFIAVLQGLMIQGHVCLQHDLAAPLMPTIGRAEYFGWKSMVAGLVFLLPDPTFRVVVHAMQLARESMPLSAQTLWERLIERGLLRPGDKGHHTSKQALGGGRPRVLVMPIRVLFEGRASEDGGGAAELLAPQP
ncbi:MAG: hypothetical protein WCJ30_22935, partial [Deltaproteobacteria bacterium]